MVCRGRFGFYDSSSWFAKICLQGGSEWKSDYDRATIAFVFITLIALVVSCIWAVVVRKRSPVARKTLVWFIPAVVFAIVSVTSFDLCLRLKKLIPTLKSSAYLWTAIDVILIEDNAHVEQLYLIFNSILSSFQLLMFASLLAAIYTFVIPLVSLGRANSSSGRFMSPMLAGHLAFCGLLAIFWLIILSLQLALAVEVVKGVGTDSEGVFEAFGKTTFTFDLLYLLGSVEVIVLSASLLTTCRGQNRQIAVVFLIGVSVPLFILSLWLIVIDGISTFDYNEGLNRQVLFARNMFYYICTIAIFVSMAFVITRLEIDDEAQTGDFPPAVVERSTPRVAGGLEPGLDKASTRDHSQDPIYNGPEMMRGV
ncbi:MAG: hypothetical protein Q9202_003627 [Teloschistes flavicans]